MPNSHKCEQCNNSFEAYRDNAKYCSVECRDTARGGKYRDKSWLREKYVEDGLKVDKIADLADCASTTVHDWLNKHDIEKRGVGYRPETPEKYRDKDWLRKKYHGEELSTAEVAELCDCHKQTIRLWLEKHGIEKRTKSEAAKIRAERHPHTTDAGAEALSNADNWWNNATQEERNEFREWLSDQRQGEDNPMADVTGSDHHNWKENTAPHQFYQNNKWKETRQKALERDGNKCTICQTETDLHVHHIRPVSDGGSKYELNNLVTLCASCHKKWEGLYLRPDTRK